MIPVKKIMAAADFSIYSKPVFEYASYFGNCTGAEVIIVNIINQRDVDAVSKISMIAGGISVQRYIEEQIQDRTSSLEKLWRETIGESFKPRIIIKPGFPYEELLNIINDEKIDLVVMGAKGRSNVANIIFGSVTEKMVRRSPVPVILVRLEQSKE